MSFLRRRKREDKKTKGFAHTFSGAWDPEVRKGLAVIKKKIEVASRSAFAISLLIFAASIVVNRLIGGWAFILFAALAATGAIVLVLANKAVE